MCISSQNSDFFHSLGVLLHSYSLNVYVEWVCYWNKFVVTYAYRSELRFNCFHLKTVTELNDEINFCTKLL